MKRYKSQLNEENNSFFDNHKKEIMNLSKNTNIFGKALINFKNDLMDLYSIARKEKNDAIIKQMDAIFKVIPEPISFVGKLSNLEDLIKK
jgi:hypothetical protein